MRTGCCGAGIMRIEARSNRARSMGEIWGNEFMATAVRQPDVPEGLLTMCISKGGSRVELWAEFIRSFGVQRMAELGVYRGDFAAEILRRCGGLTAYYMID